MDISVFDAHESDVQRYGRTFPVLLNRAVGPRVFDVDGKGYLDFILGSGALNYGHNYPAIKSALQDYLAGDSILLSLDLYTKAKAEFISEMVTGIFVPRSLDYKIQFPGPTGTNANEAAMALARKVTGRPTIFAFSNSFHGMSLGSLSVSGSESTRDLGGIAKHDVVRLPYDGFVSPDFASEEYLECIVTKAGSGVDLPAAVILETIQAEGGLNTASVKFLKAVERICRENGILLIVDDIQAGSGRTGSFFSFEQAGIQPDIVTLSKSLSGLGIPLSVVLIRPEFDVWKPGEHSGTFRGNNMAFVTGAAALSLWRDPGFLAQIEWLRREVDDRLDQLCQAFPNHITGRKGRGLMCGIQVDPAISARDIIARAFTHGLLVESSGPTRQVLKIFAPLTIDQAALDDAFGILAQSFEEVIHEG